jgi:hypothetical protein
MCAGRVERGFEVVDAAFAEVVRTQPGTGAAVAVWLDGRWLVDLWGGPADTATGRAWGRDSIVQPYSVTKPFVAVCALLLVERGELELDAVVQRYWPEFTARATVRQLLAHQAGVVALDAPAPTELFYDWQAMCSRPPPSRRPGNREPRTGGRHCSTGISSASSCAASTVAASAGSSATRSARRSGWTSRSGWARPTRSVRSISPDSTRPSANLERASPSSTGERSLTRPGHVTARSSPRRGGARQRSRP